MRLWSIEGHSLSPISKTSLANEGQLEDWLERDIDILDSDLMVIGRQVGTPHGGRIDLLAISEDGSLTVIELKRDKDNPELAEHVVLVRWEKTLPLQSAITFSGAFANQNVVCKLRDQATLDFLAREFAD